MVCFTLESYSESYVIKLTDGSRIVCTVAEKDDGNFEGILEHFGAISFGEKNPTYEILFVFTPLNKPTCLDRSGFLEIEKIKHPSVERDSNGNIMKKHDMHPELLI